MATPTTQAAMCKSRWNLVLNHIVMLSSSSDPTYYETYLSMPFVCKDRAREVDMEKPGGHHGGVLLHWRVWISLLTEILSRKMKLVLKDGVKWLWPAWWCCGHSYRFESNSTDNIHGENKVMKMDEFQTSKCEIKISSSPPLNCNLLWLSNGFCNNEERLNIMKRKVGNWSKLFKTIITERNFRGIWL